MGLTCLLATSGGCRAPHPQHKLPRPLMRILDEVDMQGHPRPAQVRVALAIYDYARVTGDRQALAALKALGLSASSPVAMARRIVALARRRGLSRLAMLVSSDLQRPGDDSAIRHLSSMLGGLARTSGRLAAPAALRCLDICRQSLLAARQRPWNRWRNASFCWSALWPKRRDRTTRIWPTEKQVLARLVFLKRQAGQGPYRILSRRLNQWVRSSRQDMEILDGNRPNLDSLPELPHAAPPVTEALVTITEEGARWAKEQIRLRRSELRPMLTEIVARSPRHHLTLAAPASWHWSDIWPVVRGAVYSGFETLGLLVRTTPQGSNDPILLGELVMSMKPLAPWPEGPRLPRPGCAPTRPILIWPHTCSRQSVSLRIRRSGYRLATGDVCEPLRPWTRTSSLKQHPNTLLLPSGGRAQVPSADAPEPTFAQALRAALSKQTATPCLLVHIDGDISMERIAVTLQAIADLLVRGQRPAVGIRLDWPHCRKPVDPALGPGHDNESLPLQ